MTKHSSKGGQQEGWARGEGRRVACEFLRLLLGFRYLPYGPLHEVMPYLIRRALENSDVLSTTEIESKLMLSEVKRRLRI